jgi:hypothetical protein
MTDEALRRALIEDLAAKRAEFVRLHSNPAGEILAISGRTGRPIGPASTDRVWPEPSPAR